MSRLKDLIRELCPAGVSYRPLGELVRIRNGRDHKALAEGEVPVYGSGGTMRFVEEWMFDGPSVLIPRKGSLGNLFFVDGPFWVVDTIFWTDIDLEVLFPKFLFHQLSAMRLGEMNQAGGVPSQTQSVLNKLQIPVPPLPVQEEIVRILDTFTGLEEELEEELEAELEARTIQYEETRKRLMAFDALEENPLSELIRELCPSGVSTNRLGNIAEIGTGSSDRKEASETGQFPFFVRSKVVMAKDDFEFDEEAIVIPGEGGIGNIFHHVVGKYALHQRAYRIHFITDDVIPRFAYFHFAANFKAHILSRAVDATVTSIRKPMIESFPIPIPPIRVQKEIVRILDSFDSLVGDLSSGLPAEIAARRKQYEYYRDKLLSFERLAA